MLKRIDSAEDVLVLQLVTDLIMENTREFYEEFLNYIEGSYKEIIVDFSKIRFIDSSGIGILLKCTEKLTTRESKLLIFGLNRQMMTVFKLAGLLKIFEVIGEDVVKGKLKIEP